MLTRTLVLLALLGATLSGCKEEVTPDPSSEYTVDTDYFTAANIVGSPTLVTKTLDDGSSATCYEITFKSNPLADGPYCPATLSDIGGLGVYDGATNPGLRAMKAALWTDMESDGYDIVDASGNVRVTDPAVPSSSSFPSCLEATADDNLTLTFYIPVTPVKLSTANQIDKVESLGISLDGVPYAGPPPSVASTAGAPAFAIPGNIPSIDPCGGHNDPSGYYHFHFGAEVMNLVLAAQGITDVSCTNVTQNTADTKLIGYAKDGYPLYVYKTIPSDLDECLGRTAATPEYPDGIYHYVLSNTDAPNLPTCLSGASVSQFFSVQ